MSLKQKNTINPNKQRKYKEKLEELLNKNRISRDADATPTHVTLDPTFPGKYFFNKDDRKTLNKLVKEANRYDVNLSIAEKPKEYGPIKADIDLELGKEDHKKLKDDRLYDNNFIMKTIELYRNAIKKFLDINPTELQVCVLEKEKMNEKNNFYKDSEN